MRTWRMLEKRREFLLWLCVDRLFGKEFVSLVGKLILKVLTR